MKKVYIVYRGGKFDAPVMKCVCATEDLAKTAMEELVAKEVPSYARLGIKNPEAAAYERYFCDEVDVRTK
jgi:hypothetical protein